MVGAIVERHGGVEDRIPIRDSRLRSFTNPFFHRSDILARYRSAFDGILEHNAFVVVRFDLQIDMTILSSTTRLANILPFGFGWASNSFPIGNLRSTCADCDFELTDEAVNDDL